MRYPPLNRSSMKKYELFYTNSRDRLFFYLLKMTRDYHLAWDLVQESFTRYLGRYSSRSESSESLLYTIARNAAMDAFRKQKQEEHPEEQVDALVDPAKKYEDRQMCNRMFEALDKLSRRDRQLLSLVVAADFSYAEIGRIMKTSEANVKVKVHRARIRLKKKMEEGDT